MTWCQYCGLQLPQETYFEQIVDRVLWSSWAAAQLLDANKRTETTLHVAGGRPLKAAVSNA